jgi:predicted nucleic acid-binding protein
MLDACSALNVAGSGVPVDDLALTLGIEFVMTDTAASEALFIEVDADGVRSRVAVHIQRWTERGRFRVVHLEQADLASFVDLASSLDDGKASTLAFAQRRGLTVVTDDRKACRVAAALDIPVVGIARLFRRWAEKVGCSDAVTGAVLWKIEDRSCFVPPRRDPDHAWWLRCQAAAS